MPGSRSSRVGGSRWDELVEGGYINPAGGIPEKCRVKFGRDEGCAIADWLRLNLELARVTGKARYWAMAERTLHNHFLQNQSSKGGFGHRGLLCDDDGVYGFGKGIEESTWCCTYHGELGLGSPTKVEVERRDPPGPGFIPMGSVVTYHFAARGNKPPVTLKWFEKGYDVPKPKRWEEGRALAGEGGMYMEGTKNTLYHGGMRPNSPELTPKAKYMEMKPELAKIERTPWAGGGPIEEWVRAIKGEGSAPGSQFDYSAPLTEMVLLGALAQRTGKTIEWDAENMLVKGQPELNDLIKEPAPEGWQYGENL
jgi:hypothetical protein